MLEPSTGVGSARFVQEFVEFHFVSEKRSRSIQNWYSDTKKNLKVFFSDFIFGKSILRAILNNKGMNKFHDKF
jgi:hypothetical protein